MPACVFIPGVHTAQVSAAGIMEEEMYFRKLVQWIREEFEEAPGLRLTVHEAAAFLGLDLATCARILWQLARAGAITQGSDGRYGTSTIFPNAPGSITST